MPSNEKNPAELLERLIRKNTSSVIRNETDIKKEFLMTHSEADYKTAYSKINLKSKIRRGYIDGIGYIPYILQTKSDLHENIIHNLLKPTLEKAGIKYKIGHRTLGEDLDVWFAKTRYRVELETGIYEHAESRPELLTRVLRYKDNTIILVLNKKQARRYKKSDLNALWDIKDIRIMTIKEFCDYSALAGTLKCAKGSRRLDLFFF
jgi:hypothetical protein